MPKIVIYLSGKTRSKQWHRECDSVAASVSVPQAWIDAMNDCMGEPLFGIREPSQMPWCDSGEIADYCSDRADDGDETAAAVLRVLECEASCGVVHLVPGRA